MNFQDKVVWITGATSGIGLELAQQFAVRGARIVLSARRKEVLEEVADALPGGSSRHWVVPMDLSEPEVVLKLAQEKLIEIGPVDIVINNGGISQRATVLESDLSVYTSLMNTNYLGTVALTKAVLPGMVQRKSGSIVAISSVAGKVGSKLRSGYSGSKFAVVGFMDCLRAEVSEHSVHCMTVCPGFIKTNIAVNALTGSGEAQNTTEAAIESGLDVTTCARKIIAGIEQGKDELLVGKGISVLAPQLKRFFPGLVNSMAARKEYR